MNIEGYCLVHFRLNLRFMKSTDRRRSLEKKYGVIINDKMKTHENDPFFVKKDKEAEAFLKSTDYLKSLPSKLAVICFSPALPFPKEPHREMEPFRDSITSSPFPLMLPA